MKAWLLDPAVQAFLQASLAALFARAAWHKARHRRAFEAALQGQGLLPARALAPVAGLLAVAEAGVAAMLLAPAVGGSAAAALGVAGAVCGAALLALYTGAMAAVWAAGRRDVDCGCGAPGAHQPIGPGLWLRNAAVIAALGAALPRALPLPLSWLDIAQLGLAVPVAALLYAAAEQARANAHRARSVPVFDPATEPGAPAAEAAP